MLAQLCCFNKAAASSACSSVAMQAACLPPQPSPSPNLLSTWPSVTISVPFQSSGRRLKWLRRYPPFVALLPLPVLLLWALPSFCSMWPGGPLVAFLPPLPLWSRAWSLLPFPVSFLLVVPLLLAEPSCSGARWPAPAALMMPFSMEIRPRLLLVLKIAWPMASRKVPLFPLRVSPLCPLLWLCPLLPPLPLFSLLLSSQRRSDA